MTEPQKPFVIPSLPGVRRDGTVVDSDYFNDAQWVRFVRNGRVRKMGGYQLANPNLSGPSRGLVFWPNGYTRNVVSFSSYGVEWMAVNQYGSSGVPVDITPAAYTFNSDTVWSFDKLFNAGGGSVALLALNTTALENTDDPTLGNLYTTSLNSPTTMTQVMDSNSQASGGVFVAAPYAVVHGSKGYVAWSDANTPSQFTTGDAGQANVTGAKIVKGLPLRTGFSQGALMWSLDSVIRMDYIGAPAIFRFSHISTDSSILSQNGVVEYLGQWYWVGLDRFYVSNGIQVQELPNDMNLNWFFDNLNKQWSSKVFAMAIPRWGEIWWFFPFGNATECTNAVIYNVRLRTWYDVALTRSAGVTPKVTFYPLMMDNGPNQLTRMTLTLTAGGFAVGDALLGGTSGAKGIITAMSGTGPWQVVIQPANANSFTTSEAVTDLNSEGATLTVSAGSFLQGDTVEGATSGATAVVQSITGAGPYTVVLNGTSPVFTTGETVNNKTRSGTSTISANALSTGTVSAFRSMYNLYTHEFGYDAVMGATVSAIPAWFTTCDFGLPTGGPQPNAQQGIDAWTRVMYVEPDFVQIGSMTLDVLGKEFAPAPTVVDPNSPYTFGPLDGIIEPRVQFREVMLRFTSNVQGGYFESGKILIHAEPGDMRK